MLDVSPAGVEPILKWAGGKASLIPQIKPHLPDRWRTYYEPFAGGLALFFWLGTRPAYVSDVNEELINLYRVVADSQLVRLLIDRLRTHAQEYALDPASYYTSIRDHYEPESPAMRAARTVFLNRTCFNGLYRVNKKGKFNVPRGSYKNPTICDSDRIWKAHTILRGARIECHGFHEVLVHARTGDFVYFDPPYVPASATANFTGYTAEGFGESEQMLLAVVFRALADRGCHVLLSNSDTPLVRNLYSAYKIVPVKARRNINSKGDARDAVDEVLVVSRVR